MLNPVIGGFHPDPSLCVVGGDIYLVCSSFAYFPGVPIWHSRDLVHWRLLGNILARASQLPLAGSGMGGGIWAPTLRHHAGRFHLVTTNMEHGGNFLVHAQDPAGPWSDPVMIDAQGWDPSLCWDADGTCYYTRADDGQRLLQAVIDPLSGKLQGSLRDIWHGFSGCGVEAPHLYHIGEWWYLVAAEGFGANRLHLATVGRSRSPWGPFENCPGNPILSQRDRTSHPIQGSGHGDLVQTADGRWWMSYLGLRNFGGMGGDLHPLGRESFLAPVIWHDGWPVVQPPELELPDPGLPAHAWPSPAARDDFDAPTLAPIWISRNGPPLASLSERPGFLRLHGCAAGLDDAGPLAFVARRQEHPYCRSACRIETAPGPMGTSPEQEVGLTLFLDRRWHFDCAIRAAGDGREVVVRRCVDDFREESARAALPPGPVDIEVLGNPWACLFTVRVDGVSVLRHKVGARFLTTSLAAAFTGLVHGVYAVGAQADVDWFEHRAWRGPTSEMPAY